MGDYGKSINKTVQAQQETRTIRDAYTLTGGGVYMAKNEKEYTCTVEYTEGCEQRLTEALVGIYYQRKRDRKLEKVTDDKTA